MEIIRLFNLHPNRHLNCNPYYLQLLLKFNHCFLQRNIHLEGRAHCTTLQNGGRKLWTLHEPRYTEYLNTGHPDTRKVDYPNLLVNISGHISRPEDRHFRQVFKCHTLYAPIDPTTFYHWNNNIILPHPLGGEFLFFIMWLFITKNSLPACFVLPPVWIILPTFKLKAIKPTMVATY